MTVICIDDTDSAERGMCTTFIGHEIAKELQEHTNIEPKTYLIRLNPAAKHKTRGNASVAIHTDVPVSKAEQITETLIDEHSYPSDPETNPGAVIADEPPETVTETVADVKSFTERAMYELLDIDEAITHINTHDLTSITRGNGRGRIGAVAALGAYAYFTDWTYEAITYRQERNWKTDRKVSRESVAAAHDEYYPKIWDNYDPITGEAVCVPNTPCPVLYGIRGDDKFATQTTAEIIESEPKAGTQVFKSNQGTDAHIQPGEFGSLQTDCSYEVPVTVTAPPETKEGGHVFAEAGPPKTNTDRSEDDCIQSTDNTITIAGFEPTKRFRDHVRQLRVGDTIAAYGEMDGDTLKLEKFRVLSLKKTKRTNPHCDACNKSMSSMGAGQGYRCSNCKDTVESKQIVSVDRELTEDEMYEVPPVARRHLAKPTVRNSFE